MTRHFMIASDFDQTLSFNDSGLVLSQRLGLHGFEETVRGLARINLVQQGGELAYLLRHDPDFRGVRRERPGGGGREVRLKPQHRPRSCACSRRASRATGSRSS